MLCFNRSCCELESYIRELSVASDSLCVAGLWLSLSELGTTLHTVLFLKMGFLYVVPAVLEFTP